MPKKTKKEKLLAQQHRSRLSPVVIQHSAVEKPESISTVTGISFSLPKISQSAAPVQTATLREYGQIKRDLTKTVIITGVILVSEFLLARLLPR